MILQDLVTYLRGNAALIAVLPAAKIFPIQAPTGTVMPYLIVEVSEGTRGKMAAQLTEGRPLARITVDGGPNQGVLAGTIIELALRALENYRGLMGGTNDLFMTCSEIRGWAGMSGTFRNQFNVNSRYVETRQVPV